MRVKVMTRQCRDFQTFTAQKRKCLHRFFEIEPETLNTCCMSPCRNHYECWPVFFAAKFGVLEAHIYKIIPADQTPGDLRRKPETKTQSSKLRFSTGIRVSDIGNGNQTLQTPLFGYDRISETVWPFRLVSVYYTLSVFLEHLLYTVLVVSGHIKHR